MFLQVHATLGCISICTWTCPLPNSDFQDRLTRINANKALTAQGNGHAVPGSSGKEQCTVGTMILGCVFISFGTTTIRKTNEHYETIRDSFELGAAVALGIVGVALLLLGCRSLWHWAKGREAARSSVPVASTAVETSSRAKTTASLFGLALGTAAALVMFLAAAYNFPGPGASPALVKLLALAALSLAVLSVVIGVTGFVARGRALMRVPACFFIGGLLTYAVVMALRVDTRAWLEYF